MEHGSLTDPSQSTFSLVDEDHTFANAARFTLNQDPRTKFCGYSIPHPSDNRVNIRIQTTGDAAKDVFNDSCQDLMVICQHVRSTFDKAVVDFRMSKSVNGMDIDSNDGCMAWTYKFDVVCLCCALYSKTICNGYKELARSSPLDTNLIWE